MKTLLIAMDLDGTLLSEDHETISARNRGSPAGGVGAGREDRHCQRPH